jgi:SsrA-binding protein
MKLITKNKKAFFDYEIIETLEAGIVLTGDEVKSLRAGKINLTGTFATIHDGELYLLNAHITPYEKAYIKDENRARQSRKLLVHKKQLKRLIGTIAQKGVTLVPLSIYFNDKNKVKVEIGICKHKKIHGKKETIKERDIERQTRRELKGGY